MSALLPISLSCTIIFAGLLWILNKPQLLTKGYAWTVFVGLVAICLMACLGLAYSLFPYIVIDRLTIWEAAASTQSLTLIFYGIAITLPAIIGCTIFVYKIFHGKASQLSYE
ncbi:MAG: cytochrome d ubiquinol oxidase subunit II [Porticoccaceae bacterium]|nr:cytochrome d ubiquinol oxidase subunit II [Porticoccaceae bacterium]